MDNHNRPILDTRELKLLLAIAIGGLVALMTHLSGEGLAKSLLAGGAATGGAILWIKAVTEPPEKS